MSAEARVIIPSCMQEKAWLGRQAIIGTDGTVLYSQGRKNTWSGKTSADDFEMTLRWLRLSFADGA